MRQKFDVCINPLNMQSIEISVACDAMRQWLMLSRSLRNVVVYFHVYHKTHCTFYAEADIWL